ncbi:MAG TPA: HD domain-containing protein [Candidatus Bathyarchaeia archaeon]
MISVDEARRLMEYSGRYMHGLLTGRVMGALAEALEEDAGLWEKVGVLHDLDYEQTRADLGRHGVAAAEVLEGRLPLGALHAIASHDHRSGVEPESLLDHSLILADALAILIAETDLRKPVSSWAFQTALLKIADAKPWIRDRITGYPYMDEVDLKLVLDAVL